MDDANPSTQSFSQEECVEWVENKNVDLRQLARSPHISINTPALSATTTGSASTTTTTSSFSSRKEDRRIPRDATHIVKQLDKNYSPKQEVNSLLQDDNDDSQQQDAPTQPHENLGRQQGPLGLRHRRRRHRESSVNTNHSKKKRASSRGRRRPTRSAADSQRSSSTAAADTRSQTISVPTMDSNNHGADFESLLEALVTKPREPLYPVTNVNRPVLPQETQHATKPTPPEPTDSSRNPYAATTVMPAVSSPLKSASRSVSFGHMPPNHISKPPQRQNSASSSVPTQFVSNSNPTNNASLQPPNTPNNIYNAPTQFVSNSHPTNNTPFPTVPAGKATNKSNNMYNKDSSKSPAAVPTSGTLVSTTSPFLGDDLQISEQDWAKLDAMTQQHQPQEERDDLQLSEQDWAKLDAMTQQHEKSAQQEPRGPPIPNAPPPIPNATHNDWNTIQMLDDSLARTRGLETKDEEFDDFPSIDFEALDKQIEERQSGAANPVANSNTPLPIQTAPPPDAAIRNPVSFTFDPQHSFIAFSRYKVIRVEVDNNSYTKSLLVQEWSVAMVKEQDRQSIHHPSSLMESSGVEVVDAKQQQPADGCILLRGEWYHTHVDAGDVVHLCSLSGEYRTDCGAFPVVLHTNPPQGSEVDDLVLVVHPDRLIPCLISFRKCIYGMGLEAEKLALVKAENYSVVGAVVIVLKHSVIHLRFE